MIDEDKLKELEAGRAPSSDYSRALAMVSSLTLSDQRRIQESLGRLFPVESLDSLNLEEELVSQYVKIRDLMDDVYRDDSVAANQRAQVANSVVSTLAHLVKLQEDLRREQTLKELEALLIEVVADLPDAAKDEFFARYEERGRKKLGL